MELLQQFNKYISDHHLFDAKDKLLLAVSGGADSAVLCALCAESKFDFAIAHCNFRLRGEESNRDEAFVRSLGKKYNIDVFVKTFDTAAESKLRKTSTEETARDLRYDWFKIILGENKFKYLLTAHHTDDNIETVLMNFFRGTGIKGLRGILPKQAYLIRPLLFAHRKAIEAYAEKNNTEFVTDSSNASDDHTRNFFRNKLIPSIENIFPNVKGNITANIERFNDISLLYHESITAIKKQLEEKKGNEIHIPVLKLLKTKPLHTVIHEIIKDYGFTAAQIPEAEKLLNSGSGKYMLSSTHRILKNRNWLIISPIGANDDQAYFIIEKETASVHFPQGELKIQTVEKPAALAAENNMAFIDATDLPYPLLLRKWKQGDYFYPLGMQKKKKLSRFFSDNKLSLADKEKVWVLESDKKIIWIVGYRIDDRFKVSGQPGYILKLNLVRDSRKD